MFRRIATIYAVMMDIYVLYDIRVQYKRTEALHFFLHADPLTIPGRPNAAPYASFPCLTLQIMFLATVHHSAFICALMT